MRGNHRHIFLNFFIMLAIIGAGISPACKFISGQQTWLEICGADGIKKVLIASEDVPESPHDQSHASAEPCAFCLTHSSVKVTAAEKAIVIVPPLNLSAVEIEQSEGVHAFALYQNTFARGPPVLL